MQDSTSQRVRTIRPAATAPAETPSGQLPASITEAFIRLVTLLNTRSDTPAGLELVVRDRATHEPAGTVPLTEDTAVAILAALTDTAVRVRTPGPRPLTAAEAEPVHDRPEWIPSGDRTAAATARLRSLLAPSPAATPAPAPARATPPAATLRLVSGDQP